MYISNGDAQTYQGFFGHVDGNGTNKQGIIENLVLENVNISASFSTDTGGIAGRVTYGEIRNCGVSGEIKAIGLTGSGGVTSIGGIAADISGNISNCYNLANITQNGGRNCYAGGIVSSFESGNILNCYNKGNVSASNYVAGIVSLNKTKTSNIINCYNTGNITGNDYCTGGIVSDMYSIKLNNCYNFGTIKRNKLRRRSCFFDRIRR